MPMFMTDNAMDDMKANDDVLNVTAQADPSRGVVFVPQGGSTSLLSFIKPAFSGWPSSSMSPHNVPHEFLISQ